MEKEKKPIYKKWWFWAIVIILVIAVAGSGNSNTNTVTKSTTSDVNNVSEENNVTENTETNSKVNAGEEISTNSTKITFVSVKDYTNYDEYSAPKNGNKVIRAEFAFENISNSDISLNGFNCYADGMKYDEYYYADDYKSPTLESLSSGKKMNAVVYYEVPQNAQSIVLEYETNYWTSDKIEFIVK